ncbi:UTP--glucose-1-phosphate uridylyltransferase GalU [Paenibacillus thiaminolyticus]|uniref:UTP--glucose-1-phosphate uridylyltransferase n=1 Tax=Paenibacillus thiaminolyticus TaxID=49283 RepID=A0AAP9DV37_PANTH|nr:UTP--glucose-1-phosphate uridylyltransferase GalU [Paenibacillus thiaminolyticus]MCY9538962.1 UTP--glucose-1-phosphate uridylyltransferase GalU [Paenibacillus thiaminolyticus]MCY9605549.1 UTP--glucose-1-phosphate uridylyltransferase GalU [Paenibacillus thiaminolyticus]MCY9609957.1 UTP--glucose-1-phosphate uridylyltransferase GalU [Paenibacillus thiaminolyticus]MCY9612614.1 UTP--glucose-1-phosphate uridylyltransferase GalU [Paenibacillus thiaminolyticus]MCY9621068.1 UTP--glucose-1-phosphate 
MKVRKAIIPAAGLGTRFLPATKAMPKEMLPIVDKPTIQYIVEEAVASGIEDIIIVTGKGKRAIEDHFDSIFELEYLLRERDKLALLEEVQKPSELADIHYIRQREPRGLGHAIWCARKFIGNEPFAVLLGDDIVEANTPCLRQMLDVYEAHEAPIVGVQPVPWEDVSRYGVVAGEQINERLLRAKQLIEKPAQDQAPSNWAIMGRYILTPHIFELLEQQKEGVHGEIQLTDAIAELSQEKEVLAYHFEGERHDVGEKLGFIKTTLHYALQRPDLRDELLKYLKDIIKEPYYFK